VCVCVSMSACITCTSAVMLIAVNDYRHLRTGLTARLVLSTWNG